MDPLHNMKRVPAQLFILLVPWLSSGAEDKQAVVPAWNQVAAGHASALYSGAPASVAALLDSANPSPSRLAGLLPAATAVQQALD